MALASRTLRGVQNINKSILYVTKTKNHVLNGPSTLRTSYRLCSDAVGSKPSGNEAKIKSNRDPALFFFTDEVQSCLLEMNLRDSSKVFQPRRESQELSDSELKFLTQEELEQEEAKATETAKYYLQLPPVLSPKEDVIEILSKDPVLQGLEQSKILITDISFGVSHRDRLIVARDADGILRYATREERYRMIQTYFPDNTRSYEPPQLFSSDNLKSLWERSEFAFILDRACVQYEPDDPDYVSITSSTYDFIDDYGKYDDLIGTRHYGSMAFYLAFSGRLDKFLNHCILTYKIQDAVVLVRVFYLTRPEIRDNKKPSSSDDAQYLKEYISQHSKQKATLAKTLNAYLELNLPTAQEEASLGKQ